MTRKYTPSKIRVVNDSIMQRSLERYYETSKSFLVLLSSSKGRFCFFVRYYRKMHE